MPWVVAIEINKLFEIGGVTYHLTHPAWPLHERPWNFWRFSDDGLRVLFSKPMGFEIIKLLFSLRFVCIWMTYRKVTSKCRWRKASAGS